MLLVLLLPLGVFYTNREPIVFELRTLPGLRLYDAFSMALGNAMTILPFLLGRRYLQTVEAQREVLKALAWGALIYAPLILIELRMSPQLNVWIYGFFPQFFGQHVRDGGYRPIVFLEHGLRVGIFLAMACLAALALWRDASRPAWLGAAAWIGIVLVLSKTLGALLICLALLPWTAFAGRRLQILAVVALAGIVIVYPTIRGAGLVPTERLLAYADAISPARAQSLEVRLRNEDQLLAKANEKPLFGWGGWGRSRVYNENGYDISITDGIWIIIMGADGWLGYLAKFGLLTLPLLALLWRGVGLDRATLGLGLVLAANLADMVPNSSLTPLTWLIAGALTGRISQHQAVPETDPATAGRRSSRRRPTAGPAQRSGIN
jgi:hypothetical protein